MYFWKEINNLLYTNLVAYINCFEYWSSGNAFVSGAVGLRFKFRADHSVANGLPPLQQFFERRCVAEMETGRVDRPVGLSVGSRFFDWPVKPVDTPIKFSFLATKRHLSSNRNIHIYCITNKTFYKKKTVLTNHFFWKHLLHGFKLWPICCDH